VEGVATAAVLRRILSEQAERLVWAWLEPVMHLSRSLAVS
jgi:hypothetical protein